MNTATLQNLLPNSKVKLADDNLVLLVSIFYNHPRLLTEDGWKLLKIGSENLLIDLDTWYILKDKEVELIWKKDHITHVKLTSKLSGEELKKHWDDMLVFANKVQSDMSSHFDKKKVDELCDSLNKVTITEVDSSVSDLETGRAPGKTLLKEVQSPQASTFEHQ